MAQGLLVVWVVWLHVHLAFLKEAVAAGRDLSGAVLALWLPQPCPTHSSKPHQVSFSSNPGPSAQGGNIHPFPAMDL